MIEMSQLSEQEIENYNILKQVQLSMMYSTNVVQINKPMDLDYTWVNSLNERFVI